MLKNYILVAFRNLKKQGFYSFINIFGLTVGISCSLFLILYILDELSYDTFHEKAPQIYRVATDASIQDTRLNICQSMAPVGLALASDFPEVSNFVRIVRFGRELVTKDEKQFYEDGFYFADSSFFSIFSFKLLEGDPRTVLTEPNTVVLSESVAKKYFGAEDPIGKTIKTGSEEWQREVTGVMQDPPSNSHMKPRALISYATLPKERSQNWGNISDWVYIELQKGSSPANLEEQSEAFMEKHAGELFRRFNAKADFYLEPLTSIYLHSHTDGQIEPTGSKSYIYIFSAIAAFMLIIASINYMNLATARSTLRSKEVGVRKVLGSHRRQLILQFVTESMVITTLSVVLSIILAFFLLPFFNELAGKNIDREFYSNPWVLLLLIGILLLVGVLAGSYPAFYLSKFQSAQVLKGRLSSKSGNATLRKTLVVIQFFISMVMVVCTWVVYDQLAFMKSKDLGFNKDQVIRIAMEGEETRSKYTVLKQSLLKNAGIVSVGSGWTSPGTDFNVNGTYVETETGEYIEKGLVTYSVDADYLTTLEIDIADGRNFSKDFRSDTAQAAIVNEALVNHMGWKEPIGKRLKRFSDSDEQTAEVKVVGVIRDFHQRALQEPIRPMVLYNSEQNGIMFVRVSSAKMRKTVLFIENIWKQTIPNRPLEYSFVEQDFYEQYVADETKGKVFASFSMLTILIACMGLFGLASFTTEQKKKEIGVRKVVGATVADIMILISKDFLKLIAIAILFAFPVAYFFMNTWLEDFAYRINPQPLSFAFSALLIFVITMITVGYHSIVAATGNPAASLKDE